MIERGPTLLKPRFKKINVVDNALKEMKAALQKMTGNECLLREILKKADSMLVRPRKITYQQWESAKNTLSNRPAEILMKDIYELLKNTPALADLENDVDAFIYGTKPVPCPIFYEMGDKKLFRLYGEGILMLSRRFHVIPEILIVKV